jgi:hypothetical protein
MIAADSLRRGSVLKLMRLWRFPVFPRWLSTERENLKITAPPRSRARPPMTHSQLFPRTDTCPTNSPAPHLSSQTTKEVWSQELRARRVLTAADVDM